MDQLHVNYNSMTKAFNHIRILKCIAVTLLQTQHKQRIKVCSGDFKMHTNKGTAFKITFRNARITYQRVWPSFLYFSKFL